MLIEMDRKIGTPRIATQPAIFLLFSAALVGTGLLPVPGIDLEEFTFRVWHLYGFTFFQPPLGLLVVGIHWGVAALLVFVLVCFLERLRQGAN